MLWITNIYTHIIYAAYDYYLSNGKSFFSTVHTQAYWDPNFKATMSPQRGQRKQHMLHTLCHNKSCWCLLPAAAEGTLNWSNPMKGQLLGEWFLLASRISPGVSARTDEEINMRAVRWYSCRTFGHAAEGWSGQIHTGVQRDEERPRLTIMDYKDPSLSDLRLLKFSWAVSSCLETDTPAGGLETLPLPKTGKRVLGGQNCSTA